MERSPVKLLYLRECKYAIIKCKAAEPLVSDDAATVKPKERCSKSKQGGKTTVRTGKRKRQASKSPPEHFDNHLVCSHPTLKGRGHARTLSKHRLNEYGIGNAGESGSHARTSRHAINYLKLNDGLEENIDKPTSPKSHKKKCYLPSRSGPSST